MSNEVQHVEEGEDYSAYVGKACTYVDPVGKEHAALITAAWGNDCVNIVSVNMASGQTDSHGQKLFRESSLMHRNTQQAHGQYWY